MTGALPVAFLAMRKRDPGIAAPAQTMWGEREQEWDASNLNDHMVLAGNRKVVPDRRNPLATRHTTPG